MQLLNTPSLGANAWICTVYSPSFSPATSPTCNALQARARAPRTCSYVLRIQAGASPRVTMASFQPRLNASCSARNGHKPSKYKSRLEDRRELRVLGQAVIRSDLLPSPHSTISNHCAQQQVCR